MKHLKHPKHLKHLKHLMWLFGLLFCKHFKELGGKVKDGVHGRQYQKEMLLFSGWIDAIADMGFWGCGLVGMEENKKVGFAENKTSDMAWWTASCVAMLEGGAWVW